jgi:hypothetical protein
MFMFLKKILWVHEICVWGTLKIDSAFTRIFRLSIALL